MILAHGLGGRADLPVPAWIAIGGAGTAVLFSFVVAYSYWYDAVLFGESGAKAGWLKRIVESKGWQWTWRIIGLAAFGLFLAAALFGSREIDENPAPTWLYVWLWVGLVPLSLLFGPVFKAMSPMRTVAGLLGGLVRPKRLPTAWGYWPATVSLFVFLWLELVVSKWAVQPINVAVFGIVYFLIHTAAGVIYGQDWFEKGEGFEAFSNVLARLAIIGRRNDGEIVFRNPLDGLSSLPMHKSLTVFVCLLLGSTAFDGITRQSIYKELTKDVAAGPATVAGTLGLVGSVAAVWLLFTLAMKATNWLVPTTYDLKQEFAHTLVPISIGYTVAHYFSYAAFNGQDGILLGADPFFTGANWLGIKDWAFFQQADGTVGINQLFIGVELISWTQVLAVVLGHFVGVMCAHDRSLRLLKPRDTVGQLPMLITMIVFTCMGIYLLLGL